MIAQIYRSARPWIAWLILAISCAVGYLVYYVQFLGRSGAWVAGPTLIVTFVVVMVFAIFVWMPAYWALGKWYRHPGWIEAIAVSGILGTVLTTVLGIGPFTTDVGSPLYTWFLLVTFMLGAGIHVWLVESGQPRK